ncbi:MAG: glycosyltransferase family 39 protein [Chloroflexota bacterium]|nr:glycosyltransferase family 39 protein [Chloroflexota bacterium]
MRSIIKRFVERFGKERLILGALVIFIAIQLPYKLSAFPPFWWDEGNVVLNPQKCVELGGCDCLLGAGSVGVPALAPIALSFRLLGIGVRQARLPGVLFTVGALTALWLLARRLYDRSMATVTVTVTLLLSTVPHLHPIVMGRQAMGDMPALFFLLIGLLFLQRAWHRPSWFLPLAVVFWSLAMQTKRHIFPFLAAALLLPMALMLWKRRFREAWILGSGLLGTIATTLAFAWIWPWCLGGTVPSYGPVRIAFGAIGALVRVCAIGLGHGVPSSGSAGNVVASMASSESLSNVFQPNLHARAEALLSTLLAGIPTVLGLGYAGRQLARDVQRVKVSEAPFLGQLVLWTLTAAWFAWYLLLSIGWARYLLPIAFLGSVFIAALLHHLTDGFSAPPWRQWAVARRKRFFSLSKMGTLVSLVILPAALLLTVYYVYIGWMSAGDDTPLLETVRFLNTHTASDALIEVDDRELLFLLKRAHHHPGEEVHKQLYRRVFLKEDVTIDYDPLAEDPDYLVVGLQLRLWGLYDSVLETEAFRLVYENEPYRVYERVREGDARSQPGGD